MIMAIKKKKKKKKGLAKFHIVSAPSPSGGRSIIWYSCPLRNKATTAAIALVFFLSLSLSPSVFSSTTNQLPMSRPGSAAKDIPHQFCAKPCPSLRRTQ